jgi:hypothetical protein
VAPPTVISAALLQGLLAALFLIIPVVVARHGGKAQRAAEAEVVRQGVPAGVLARHRVRFDERPVEFLLPVAIGLGLATLAWLNLAGNGTGRVLSWVLQPILLVAGGLITGGQVFPTRSLESAFRKSTDPTLRGIDVAAFVDAARRAFPAWLRQLIVARFVLVTAGSLLASCCWRFRRPAPTSARACRSEPHA